jgi:hypothetical protein
MSKHKIPDLLPTIDARQGHTVSTLIVALTGMMNGKYGDIKYGDEHKDFLHISRLKDGMYRAEHKSSGWKLQTDSPLRIAQIIVNRVRVSRVR